VIAGVGIAEGLAMAYAVVLLLVAYGIDTLARRSAAKVESDRAGGFVYHEDHDAWLCPEDQWLWPQSFDPDNRVMRYRGSPTVCNACPVKDTCTTSHDGREVSRAVDSWPASEAARFHRGIACAITVLAVLWPLAMAAAADTVTASLVLLAAATGVGVLSLPLWSHLRRSPAVPEGVRLTTLDENLDHRTQVALAHQRRRTTYGSDRREERPSAYASERRDVQDRRHGADPATTVVQQRSRDASGVVPTRPEESLIPESRRSAYRSDRTREVG